MEGVKQVKDRREKVWRLVRGLSPKFDRAECGQVGGDWGIRIQIDEANEESQDTAIEIVEELKSKMNERGIEYNDDVLGSGGSDRGMTIRNIITRRSRGIVQVTIIDMNRLVKGPTGMEC